MDRKLKNRLPDTRTIDIEDLYAVEFWAEEFRVSHSKLIAAVKVVGVNAPDVKRELNKK
jgi:hypothetical protein